jgi:hypothetical protein
VGGEGRRKAKNNWFGPTGIQKSLSDINFKIITLNVFKKLRQD